MHRCSRSSSHPIYIYIYIYNHRRWILSLTCATSNRTRAERGRMGRAREATSCIIVYTRL
jgi:hypothetical protein